MDPDLTRQPQGETTVPEPAPAPAPQVAPETMPESTPEPLPPTQELTAPDAAVEPPAEAAPEAAVETLPETTEITPLTPPDPVTPVTPVEEPPPAPPEPQGMLVLGGTPLLTDSPEPEPQAAPDPADVCRECGGTYGVEGYCDQCGAARPDERLHYEIDAGYGVAAVCDRGIRHVTNEDATAVAASDDGTRRIAMVVADGVSTAPRSAEASSAAVQAALDVLTSTRSTGLAGVAAALVGALSRRLVAATEAAADAVREITEMPDDGAPDLSGIRKAGHPACTFVAAVVEGDTAAVASLGDSRAYWLPDAGGPQRLTTDDSWANEQIRLGVDPAEAERGPHAHTITKWLGVDCPDMTPEVASLTLDAPGYLMVCSDGLWNYASAPEEIAGALQQARSGLPPDAGVVDLASALVDWANACGGQDNVTVALARIDSVHASQQTQESHQSQQSQLETATEPTQEIPAPTVQSTPPLQPVPNDGSN